MKLTGIFGAALMGAALVMQAGGCHKPNKPATPPQVSQEEVSQDVQSHYFAVSFKSAITEDEIREKLQPLKVLEVKQSSGVHAEITIESELPALEVQRQIHKVLNVEDSIYTKAYDKDGKSYLDITFGYKEGYESSTIEIETFDIKQQEAPKDDDFEYEVEGSLGKEDIPAKSNDNKAIVEKAISVLEKFGGVKVNKDQDGQICPEDLAIAVYFYRMSSDTFGVLEDTEKGIEKITPTECHEIANKLLDEYLRMTNRLIFPPPSRSRIDYR